jgi:AcrR family transcriptional regulator
VGQQATPGGLSLERLIAAGLETLEADGLDGLSMRAVADRLGVKAASLYWHVRDRRALLALITNTVLSTVELPVAGTPWRVSVPAVCASLDATLEARRDFAALLIETRGAFEASPVVGRLLEDLAAAGLASEEARSAVTMLLAGVVVARLRDDATQGDRTELVGNATVLIDTASFGVTLRAGTAAGAMATSIPSPEGDASVVVKGTSVVVRRPRGRGRSEVHLDPRYRWSVRVGGATSHTRLLLSGLHLDDLKIDSGATRIDVVLPRPEGVVRVDISSGVTGVRLHRPRGTSALAQVSAGALRLRLDGVSTLAVLADDRWTSDGSAAGDRYELRVNSGTVDVLLDQRAPAGPPASGTAVVPVTSPAPPVDSLAAVELLLDGIEARVGEGERAG